MSYRTVFDVKLNHSPCIENDDCTVHIHSFIKSLITELLSYSINYAFSCLSV